MLHWVSAMKINRRGSGESGRIIPGKICEVNSVFQGVAKPYSYNRWNRRPAVRPSRDVHG